MDNNLERIDVETIVDTFSTLIEQGTEAVVNFFKSDTWESVLDIGSELSKASKVIVFIRKTASIPDKFFMNKMEKYCQGLISIPKEKRAKYAKKVGKAGLNKDAVFILGILNKIEELSKIKIFLALFEAKMDEKIDEETYRRMMLLVDHTMYSDILYLKSNYTDNEIIIQTAAEQGLYANGWLIYCGQTWGTATEYGNFIYQYTKTAKQFCELISL